MAHRHRVLVAGTPAEKQPLKTILGDCEAKFVQGFAEGIAVLESTSYAFILVAIDFAESRMFDFILEVRRCQPSARVVAIHGPHQAPLRKGIRTAVEFALRQISADGLVDLSSEKLSNNERELLKEIVELCRGTADPAVGAPA